MEPKIDMISPHAGIAQGILGNHILANSGSMNPLAHRPYIDPKTGNSYVTVFKGGDAKKPENYGSVRVNAATLRKAEWQMMDEAVLRVSESRLNGVQDLKDHNLVKTIGNAMGSTVLEYQDLSSALEAKLSMDGLSRGENDRQVYTTKYLPLPIIHVDYQINHRVLMASRNMGNSIDTDLAERAARAVANKLENMLFTATSYSFGGGTIYSYINNPNRNTVAIGTNWDASAKTPKQIVEDVLKLKKANIAAKHYGPYMVYIPTAYETILDQDYDATTPGTTIRERILKIDKISGIKVIDTLPDHNILCVEMNSDTVRWINGMNIQNIQWKSEGDMVTNFKVMGIQLPQIRADQLGNSGIAHMS